MASYILDDISDLLTTGGIATTIYCGFMPEKVDEAIQIVSTGGYPPVRAMSGEPGNAKEERPTIQIIRRSMTLQRCVAEMNAIWKLLDGFGDRSINGTPYKWIEAMQSPFPLGRDATNRTEYACNFIVCKALSTSTST